MVDWASLLPELVEDIANCVLSTATGGIGSYMDMRAVCTSWRYAIAKPSPHAAVADLRFRPRNWVMVDEKSEDYEYGDYDDGTRLFFHILSGRFRRMRLPVLRDEIILGASEGLLVLIGMWSGDLTSVLNPLTGDRIHFPATLHDYILDRVFIALNGASHSTLVLWWRGDMVQYASPTSDVFTEKEIDTELTSMVAFQGNIYYTLDGQVFKIVGQPEQFHHELVAQVLPNIDVCLGGQGNAWSSLVESDGELLLLRLGEIALKVFKVDNERKLLEEVKSLGHSRALFFGSRRCLSVDAGNLPSIEGDCIYFSDMPQTHAACVYSLMGDKMEIITRDYLHDRPLSLVQVLLKYCDFDYM